MLRDGRYIEELKDLNQYLGGSKNQRYINCKESLKRNKVIEYDWRN
jgi:anaerobic ribonucleoside-triphosphate reductase activating protein